MAWKLPVCIKAYGEAFLRDLHIHQAYIHGGMGLHVDEVSLQHAMFMSKVRFISVQNYQLFFELTLLPGVHFGWLYLAGSYFGGKVLCSLLDTRDLPG